MSKVHLRGNKALNGQAEMAICATRSIGNGKVVYNDRSTYARMSSKIVGYVEFKDTPAANRCAHCMEEGLIRKNMARKAKGQPLAKCLFDKLD